MHSFPGTFEETIKEVSLTESLFAPFSNNSTREFNRLFLRTFRTTSIQSCSGVGQGSRVSRMASLELPVLFLSISTNCECCLRGGPRGQCNLRRTLRSQSDLVIWTVNSVHCVTTVLPLFPLSTGPSSTNPSPST